jgi:hypothetical protein
MCRAVITNETGTIQDHADRQVLHSNVMDNLIVSTLQKG